MNKQINRNMYWRVGDKKFYNKWLALGESELRSVPIHFYFFDREFSLYEWSREPRKSWEGILRERALQLRSKYDYLRVFYSGGVDSQTVLNTFIKNDIHIDEIVVYRCSVYTNDFDKDPAELELTKVALPFLRKIQNNIPKTRITILETTPEMLSEIVTEEYFEESSTFAIRPWKEKHLYKLHPSLWGPFQKGMSHCDIRGGDKPKVFYENGTFYTAMWDSSRLWDIEDHFLENFYITPEMPDVYAKQCYLAARFLLNLGVCPRDFVSYFNPFDTKAAELVNKACRDSRHVDFSLGKGVTGTVSSKQVLVELKAKKYNRVVYDKWDYFLRNKGSGHLSWFNNHNVRSDFKGILSKKYRLVLSE